MNETDETGVPRSGSIPGQTSVGPLAKRPRGLRRADQRGADLIDALAGRASVFGFGFEPIVEAIQAAAESYLGDGSGFAPVSAPEPAGDAAQDGLESRLRTELLGLLGGDLARNLGRMLLCASPDAAIETAIWLARRQRAEKAFRTVALIGADHGRSGVGRTASGRPELHEGYGPMMPGFVHVPAGDLDAMAAAVDDQTACVLLSPINFSAAAQPCDADYLAGLRELCDERQLLLVIDETQLTFGSSGQPLACSAISPIVPDLIAISGGLFAGLPGGLVLASDRLQVDRVGGEDRFPLQAAVALATLTCLAEQRLPSAAVERMEGVVKDLAELLSGFEFVRDLHVLGMSIGIASDIESADLVRTARRRGLRIEAAGDTGVCLQLPLVVSDEDKLALLGRLGETLKAIERETADLSI